MAHAPAGFPLLRRFNLLAAAALLLLVAFTAYDRWREYEAALDFAELMTKRIARTIEEHATQSFGTVETTLRWMAALRPGGFTGELATQQIAFRELRREALKQPEIDDIALLTADGTVLYEEDPARRSGLRGYLAGAGVGSGAARNLRFGNVGVHPLTGDRYIAVTLALPANDGSGTATLVAAVDPDYFQAFYDSIDLGPRGGISLFRRDGTLLVRRPFSDELINQVFTGPLFSKYLPRAESGTFHERVQTDGAVRIVSYRALPNYPLVVAVGLREDDLLADWRRSLGVSAAVFAAVALLLAGLYLQSRRLVVAHLAAEESRRDSERRFAELAANVPGIVYRAVLDRDGHLAFSYVSEGMRQKFGLSPDDVCGRSELFVDRILPPYRELFWRTLHRSSVTGAVWRVEFEAEDIAGQPVWIRSDGRPTPAPGGGTTWDGILIDVSDAKRLEADRQWAAKAALEASQAKSKFLAHVSHELRTPLNAIIGFSEAMADQGERLTAERRTSYVADIRRSGEHLLALVNGILDLTRIEAGSMPLDESWIVLADVVRGCEQIVHDQALAGGLRIVARFPDDLPELYADATAVRRIVLNLLSNSIKNTPPGGSITVSAERGADGGIVLTVGDTGTGMPPHIAQAAFEPFQAHRDAYIRNQGGGMGLGLAICERLVRLHGWMIRVASDIGTGTAVTIVFPASRVQTER